jgi:hypothetical protein
VRSPAPCLDGPTTNLAKDEASAPRSKQPTPPEISARVELGTPAGLDNSAVGATGNESEVSAAGHQEADLDRFPAEVDEDRLVFGGPATASRHARVIGHAEGCPQLTPRHGPLDLWGRTARVTADDVAGGGRVTRRSGSSRGATLAITARAEDECNRGGDECTRKPHDASSTRLNRSKVRHMILSLGRVFLCIAQSLPGCRLLRHANTRVGGTDGSGNPARAGPRWPARATRPDAVGSGRRGAPARLPLYKQRNSETAAGCPTEYLK